LAEGDIKSIVAEVVAATMDARELAKQSRTVKEFRESNEDFQASQQ